MCFCLSGRHRTVEFCPRWAQETTRVRRVKQQSWGSCRASEEVICVWGLEFKGSTSLEEKPLCRGRERGDSTRVALNVECHRTMELCGTLQGVTSAGMNATSPANAGQSPDAAPSWSLGTSREHVCLCTGEMSVFTPWAASQ